ncbi:penicillin acylase family protein [Brytella acorum]|uniref:Penicillin acylase family protein n=1 Tax=Brytella acorum TaxID=2959299 RepID=A0AA35UHU6_9PROT|nr:penicillin acylase family protein [Brytella acorum]MDF3625750.1 penicillin acylase family protein [Brytella acorum]CAI9121659.1 penicillin acylase family protein [Brytella acorum]
MTRMNTTPDLSSARIPSVRKPFPRRPLTVAVTVAAGLSGIVAVGLVLAGGYGWHILHASRPQLDGQHALPGLSSSVSIARDADGVPTLTARNREDLARALGFLHGQERFFEMDLLRRTGGGTLSELVGPVALSLDRRHRLHRFRARAGRLLASQSDEARAVLDAYTKGVNAGLNALGHAPFEYTILRAAPTPWTAEDSLLVVDAMYFDLQSDNGEAQQLRGTLTAALGPEMTAFLDPEITAFDAPDDGSVSALPPMPTTRPNGTNATSGMSQPPPAEHGSNSFAISGALTRTGSAMIANDMHLDLGVPNIWYRARQIVAAPDGPAPMLDLNGVTLPGMPFQVVGTNGAVAWGFTDGYVESGDLIRLDMVPAERENVLPRYQTPNGPRTVEILDEPLCAARAPCRPNRIEQTVWGPIMGHDSSGAPLVWRWSAEDDNAIGMEGFLDIERATDIRHALDAAHRAALPAENMLVGDRAGHIAWTIIGMIPRRVGLNDRLPHSWANGTHGWNGYLTPAEVPEIIDPPGGRLWTANGRIVGGAALATLGDGGYADGMRASQIRDRLQARDSFTETDLKAIQLDDHATQIAGWQTLLLRALDRHAQEPAYAGYREAVMRWGGHAVPESIGYRLVRTYREHAIATIFGAWAGGLNVPVHHGLRAPARSAWAVEKMLTDRPPALVPPGSTSWDATEDRLLADLTRDVWKAGGLDHYRWGAFNHVGIHHPLARVVPLLGFLTDPPDVPEAGDTLVPRVQSPGFGASERIVVSPGHEQSALFEMPAGQAANPLSPYFLRGHEAWVNGQARALLPGRTETTLTLVPR